MHSSSAQRLQRLRVITSHLLKSIHGFGHVFVLTTGRQRLLSVVVVSILLGGQLFLWRSMLVNSAAHVLATGQTGTISASERVVPLTPSVISRVDIPLAGISAPVLDVSSMGHDDSTTHQWSMPRYALGHHAGTGVPGQGKNIVFSAVSGEYGRLLLTLDRAVPGTTVTLYEGDTAHAYTVVSQQLIPNSSALSNIFVDDGTVHTSTGEQVTLITSWPPTGSDRYSQYLIVIAKPIS